LQIAWFEGRLRHVRLFQALPQRQELLPQAGQPAVTGRMLVVPQPFAASLLPRFLDAAGPKLRNQVKLATDHVSPLFPARLRMHLPLRLIVPIDIPRKRAQRSFHQPAIF
jgi:hypothetical protein